MIIIFAIGWIKSRHEKLSRLLLQLSERFIYIDVIGEV